MNHDHSVHDAESGSFWGSRYSIGLIVLGAVAAYFLLTEHRAHFFGALPFLLLACLFMHLFMHGGHGGHGRRHQHGAPERPESPAPPQPVKFGEQP